MSAMSPQPMVPPVQPVAHEPLLHRLLALPRIPKAALETAWDQGRCDSWDRTAALPGPPSPELAELLISGVSPSAAYALAATVTNPTTVKSLVERRRDSDVAQGAARNMRANLDVLDAVDTVEPGLTDEKREVFAAIGQPTFDDSTLELIVDRQVVPAAVQLVCDSSHQGHEQMVDWLANVGWSGGIKGAERRRFRLAVIEDLLDTDLDAAVSFAERLARTSGACLDAGGVLAAEAAITAGRISLDDLSRLRFDTDGAAVAVAECPHLATIALPEAGVNLFTPPPKPKSRNENDTDLSVLFDALDMLGDGDVAARFKVETGVGLSDFDSMFETLEAADDQTVVDWMERRTGTTPGKGAVVAYMARLDDIRRGEVLAEIARRPEPTQRNTEIVLVIDDVLTVDLNDAAVREIRSALSTSFQSRKGPWEMMIPLLDGVLSTSLASMAESIGTID